MVTPVEGVKAKSEALRGTIAEELANPERSFSSDAGHLLKFHGIYQQDDRDRRRELRLAKADLAYSCMVRCSVPGGVLQPEQWAEIDRLADDVADGSLRLTSRQGVQYHFVNKENLHELIGSLNRGLVTTYAACGDVVRNIMVTSAPDAGRDLGRLQGIADGLAKRFRPQSSAYWELWLDGERAVSSGPSKPDLAEPIYSQSYLPRKFKIGIAWPGDNSTDVYSQDVGLILAGNERGEAGAVVVAGGGLGRSHKDSSTFPRLAEPVAWIPDGAIGEVVEAIVTTFRDEGNRDDRSHARLKYLVEADGIAWLRKEVELRLGRELDDPIPVPSWTGGRASLGWHRQGDGRWYLGLPVPSGRLEDSEHTARRTAVREIVANNASEVRLTPQQDLLLCGIRSEDRSAVDAILRDYGVPGVGQLPLTVVSSMACPALPTCGQALGEAERVLPELTELLDRLLSERGLGDVPIETRMTGCPNGCSRPYVAELGIVGRTKTAYDLFVGGDPAGTRLAELLIESVPFQKLGDVLGPLLDRFRQTRLEGEPFGDWANRLGTPLLRSDLPTFGRPGIRDSAVGRANVAEVGV